MPLTAASLRVFVRQVVLSPHPELPGTPYAEADGGAAASLRAVLPTERTRDPLAGAAAGGQQEPPAMRPATDGPLADAC